MASWIKSFFGGNEEVPDIPLDLQKMLDQAKRDRRALGDLLDRSERVQRTLQEGLTPLVTAKADVEAISQRMTDLQGKVDSFRDIPGKLDSVEQRAKDLAESQSRSEARLTDSSQSFNDLEAQVREIQSLADQIVVGKEDISELAGPNGTVATLLNGVELLRQEVQQLQERTTGLKESASQIDIVDKRLEKVSKFHSQLEASLERTSGSAAKLDGKVTALDKQVAAAADAKKAMAELTGPKGALSTAQADLDRLKKEFNSLEGRARELGQIEGRVAGIAKMADSVAEDQRKALAMIQSTSEEAGKMNSEVSGLRAGLRSVAEARQEIAEYSGPGGALSKLREQMEEAQIRFLDYGQEVARVREDQADTRGSLEELMSRYAELRTKMDGVDQGVESASNRVASIEITLQELTQAEELAGRTERQLNALRGLADHVSQKAAALESQRESIDRTEANARALTDLHWELDSKLKEARAQVKEVKKVNASIDALHTLHAKVAEQSDSIRVGQKEIRREDKRLRSALAGMQKEVLQSAKSFGLEQAHLKAVDQRIADLRSGVTEFENRFRALDGVSQQVSEVQRRGDHLAAHLTSLSARLDQLSEQVELVEGMRDGMTRAEASAVEAASRLEKIEARQSEVQDAVRDLTDLRGSREEVLNALERLRATRAEIERMQAGQLETRAWLSSAQESIGELRRGIAELDDLTANVDHMRQNADLVVAAASHLEAREPSLTELDNRMSELRDIGTQLDERTSNLLVSVADADRRFEAVATRAEAADKVRAVIEGVTASVRKAEGRMAEVGNGVDAAVERAEFITSLSERVDRVGADIAQRQQALDKATEHLDRVATLRQEAATAVQSLEDQLRSLTEHLSVAVEQSKKVGKRAEQMEARAGSLRFAEKRITQFEEKLAELDKVEQELSHSVETLSARKGSVDQVRDEVQDLFAQAERTLDEMRAISSASDEVHAASENLKVVLAKTEEMTEVLTNIDGRQKQVEEAERRLARAEGLLMDIRAGLESLRSQKAVVDQVIATSGQLTIEAKEAERLLVALRQERNLTQGIHEALKEMREDDSEARAG